MVIIVPLGKSIILQAKDLISRSVSDPSPGVAQISRENTYDAASTTWSVANGTVSVTSPGEFCTVTGVSAFSGLDYITMTTVGTDTITFPVLCIGPGSPGDIMGIDVEIAG